MSSRVWPQGDRGRTEDWTGRVCLGGGPPTRSRVALSLSFGSGWAAPSSVHEAFTGGGRATAAASFPCTSPSPSFILPRAGSPPPCGAGTAGRTQPGPCPPANETGREAWAGPRPPCPHGSWGTNRRGIPEAERDSAGRRPRASLCHRTSSAGHSSVGEGEVPPREHRVRPEEGPGLATLVPAQSPRQRWEAASLAGSLSWLSLPSLPPPPPPCVI